MIPALLAITAVSVIIAPLVGLKMSISVASPSQRDGMLFVVEKIGDGLIVTTLVLLIGSVHPAAVMSKV